MVQYSDAATRPLTRSLLTGFYEEFHHERGKARGEVSVPVRVDYIRRKIGSGQRVIELGCRYGALLATFKEGNTVVGVDIDEAAAAECARDHGVETHVVNLNDRLPFDDAQFDAVVISEVLEHLPYADITLGEAARLLRPGGHIVGSVPNATRLRNRIRFLTTGVVETDRTHIQHFSPGSLRSCLERHFRDVETELVGGRLAALRSEHFANYILFSGTKR